MSAAQPHPHDPRHFHGHEEGETPHASFKGYMTGFVLSVILTAIPFWLVMTHALADKYVTTLIILTFAAVQMVVHMVFFLHMNTRSEGGWNMLALIFTIVLVVIAVSGSFWIMYEMNSNMMPMPQHHDAKEMREMP